MKAIILAAILALTPTSAMAASPTQSQTTMKEITEEAQAEAQVCAGLYSGQLKFDQVATALNLDTSDKKVEFVLHCELFKVGFEAGVEVAQNRNRAPLPEASSN
jgi:hypothetical protein